MTEHIGASITPFLTFEGKAEEALRYYSSVFASAELISQAERFAVELLGSCNVIDREAAECFAVGEHRYLLLVRFNRPIHASSSARSRRRLAGATRLGSGCDPR